MRKEGAKKGEFEEEEEGVFEDDGCDGCERGWERCVCDLEGDCDCDCDKEKKDCESGMVVE